MKKQLVLLLMVVGTFIATNASAQPYFSARIGIRLPQPRVFCAPAPPPVVVYRQPVYQQPVYEQPVYDQPVCEQPAVYPNQVYDNTVVYDNRPGYYRGNVVCAGPRVVEVNRYHDRYYNHYHEGYRNGGYRRW